jgi:hypothetical protein
VILDGHLERGNRSLEIEVVDSEWVIVRARKNGRSQATYSFTVKTAKRFAAALTKGLRSEAARIIPMGGDEA